MLYVWFLKNMSTVWIAEETSEREGEGERRMENGGEWCSALLLASLHDVS